MKTKTIIRSIGTAISLFVLIVFVIIGCSKDNTDDNSNAFSPGHIWPAGDYPSLVAPNFNDAPTIGEPILTYSAIHTGNFTPMLQSYLGKDWHGSVQWIKSPFCVGTDHWNLNSENIWNNLLPPQDFYFDFDCFYYENENKTFGADDFNWNAPRRLSIMNDGIWKEGEFSWEVNHGDLSFRTYFKFVMGHPDLYMSMHRDWIYESGTDVIQSGEGTRKITTYAKTGVTETQMTKITETLELGVDASYGPVSASINQTFSNETTNQIEFSKIDSKEIEETYMIPANETWRFITLYGVERYSFTDSDGNEWISPNLVTDELGYIEDHVRTFVMIVKYKSASLTPISSELIELELSQKL